MTDISAQVKKDRALYDATPSMALTPMAMIERAVTSGATVETIDKLMALQERWEKNEGLKAFNVAIADAKAEIKPIARTRMGHNNKRYADMAAVANGVDTILSQHGLGYRYRSTQDDKISVTCILFHRLGHSEETTLAAAPDNSGSKNAVQAIGSTATYLERYTLMLALGLAAGEDDDGGRRGETITDAQADKLQKLITEIGGKRAPVLLDGFLKKFKVPSVADLPAREMQNAVDALELKRKPKAAP